MRKIFDQEGNELSYKDIAGDVAYQIHVDLAAKFVSICKKHPQTVPKDMPEFDEIQKIWDVMDFIEINYMKTNPQTH